MSLSSQSIVNNDTDSSAPGNTIMVKKPGADSLVTKLDTRIAELEAELKGYKGKGNSEETHDADFVVSTSKNISSPRLRINLAGRKSLSTQSSRKPPLDKGPLKRSVRAAVRIMYDYKVPEADIATTYNRSVNYIQRVLDQNSDNTEEDYDHVDEKTKTLYPPRPAPRRSVLKFKRARETDDAGDNRATKLRRTEASTGGKSRGVTSDSDVTQVNQTQDAGVPQVLAAPTSGNVLRFLQGLKPSMERLFPAFEAGSFDDEMLRAVTNWPDGEINELLRDLAKSGFMSDPQRFVVYKGIIALRDT